MLDATTTQDQTGHKRLSKDMQMYVHADTKLQFCASNGQRSSRLVNSTNFIRLCKPTCELLHPKEQFIPCLKRSTPALLHLSALYV